MSDDDDDDDDDLFAESDGGDTDELIANSKVAAKKKKITTATNKKRKRDIPDADNDSDDEGLFGDSDDEKKKDPTPKKKVLTKKERMEALTKKKRQEQQQQQSQSTTRGAGSKGQRGGRGGGGDEDRKTGDGYESEESYDSADFVRTQEDNDFIDTEGDDEEAVRELYADQHFDDDEHGEAMEDRQKKKKIKGVGSDRERSERQELAGEDDDDNPIMQAVKKMAKKKRTQKKLSELEEEAKPFLARMTKAADEDDEAIAQKRPAMKKLGMLKEVCETLARRDMARVLLDLDLLVICKRWIQPLPNGTLGNVTVRSRLMTTIALMTGENGITPHDLKRSEFGKTVMSLYMHKSETREMKQQLKALIDQWSRPIFQKSGNMRDLERVHYARGATGISQISRTQQMHQPKVNVNPAKAAHRGGKDQDLNSLIASGSKGKTESGINRVRVPYSKGFHYSVRPESRTTGDVDRRRLPAVATNDARGKLSKRMVEKARTVSKNFRSANVSIEGRAAKP